jgi:dihydroorotase-like cyclic amidohydrolase
MSGGAKWIPPFSQIGGSTLEVPNADEINGQGRTLLPGLIDAHVPIPDHAEEASRQALELGVTTQLDMFTNGDKLKKIKRLESEDRADLADMRTAGTGATAQAGILLKWMARRYRPSLDPAKRKVSWMRALRKGPTTPAQELQVDTLG